LNRAIRIFDGAEERRHKGRRILERKLEKIEWRVREIH
jgi:hypothetical protein